MSRVPGAQWRPIPETNSQGRITPTQFIIHSLAAPWTGPRTEQFWEEAGVNTESHLYVEYDGDKFQFVDTNVRADANVSANSRAISVETAANTSNTDSWTTAQINSLVELMVWAHKHHGIPARICRSSTDPGFGVHRMFSAWSGGGTYCPGDARAKQFTATVFPKFLAAVRAGGGSTPAPTKPTMKVSDVQVGKTNASVKAVQTALIKKGFKIPAGATGYFGSQTLSAYKLYQRSLGYTGADADGRPGITSLTKLMTSYKVV